MSCGEHRFKGGEVSATHGDDGASMEQFSIKLLNIIEYMPWSVVPFSDCQKVFLLFGWGEGNC